MNNILFTTFILPTEVIFLFVVSDTFGFVIVIISLPNFQKWRQMT